MGDKVSGTVWFRTAVVCVIAWTVGCGGGTTGTSSTGELKIAGYAQGASGERLSALPMTVRSGGDQSELLASKTDAEGSFSMSLPGSESSVLIEIGNQQSAPIARRFSGSSVLSTVLTLSPSGSVVPEGGFEVKINEDSLCQTLAVEGNQLYLKGASSELCIVQVQIASSTYRLSSFIASLEGRCNGVSSVLSNASANTAGVVSIDVSRGLQDRCTSLRILLSSRADPGRQVDIPIE